MTVVPFLRGRVFEPQDIQAMSAVFDDVCQDNQPGRSKYKSEEIPFAQKFNRSLRTRANVTRRSCAIAR